MRRPYAAVARLGAPNKLHSRTDCALEDSNNKKNLFFNLCIQQHWCATRLRASPAVIAVMMLCRELTEVRWH
eukprot:2448649-Rhodomonas_salina.2